MDDKPEESTEECRHRWYWLMPRNGFWWRKCWDCEREEATEYKYVARDYGR